VANNRIPDLPKYLIKQSAKPKFVCGNRRAAFIRGQYSYTGNLSTMQRLSIWIPSLMMMFVSLISYVDRNTLALLAPTILKETSLTAEQYGWIIAAFSISYAISNPVWGILLDKFGLRTGMLVSVTLWTLASAAHSLAGGFWTFVAARAALGFGEGATFPGGLRAAQHSLPASLRSRGTALSFSGGSLGAILTPLIITPIAARWTWRGAFLFTGIIGIVWLAAWFFIGKGNENSPTLTLEQTPTTKPQWTDARIWSFAAAYALGALPLGFVIYISSLYLSRVLGKTQAEIGAVLWLPPVGWEIGYFFWGWITDRTLQRTNPRRAYRLLFGSALILSLPLASVPYLGRFDMVMAELFFAMFVASGFIIIPLSYATHVYGRNNSGLIAGLGAGAWSAVVAVAMPWFGRLFDRQLYSETFLYATLFPIAGFVLWNAASKSLSNQHVAAGEGAL
jgi:ACS family hexuronate transporter-like MFS transporter